MYPTWKERRRVSSRFFYSLTFAIPTSLFLWYLLLELYSHRYLIVEVVSNIHYIYKSLLSALGG